MRLIQSLKKLLGLRHTKSHHKPRQIDVRPDGFRILAEGKDVFQINWSDIGEVTAFNWDEFAYTIITLQFKDLHGNCTPVFEDDIGFMELGNALKDALPGSDGAWYEKVAFLGFDPTITTVYSRSAVGRTPPAQ